MIDWIKYHTSAGYLFQANPHNNSQNIYYFLILFGLILILGLIFSIYFKNKSKTVKPYRKLSEKIFNHSMWVGILGLIYVFFRWQQIPYLSSPIVLLAIIALFIYLVISLLIYSKNKIIKEIEKFNQDISYKKYLPKKQFK